MADAEMLKKVEHAEGELFQMGCTDFRVRVFHGAARLQFQPEDMMHAIEKRKEIRERLAPWFDTVLLDMKGREP